MIKRISALILLAVMTVTILTGCGVKQRTLKIISSYEDMNADGVNIGVVTGTIFDAVAGEYFPNAKISYYDRDADMIVALRKGQLDAVLEDEPIAVGMAMENTDITCLDGSIEDDEYSFILTRDERGNAVCEELNDFFAEYRENGDIEALIDIWQGNNDELKTIDTSGITGERGDLEVAVCSGEVPYCYVKDNELSGILPSLVTMFCAEYGYRPVFNDISKEAMLAAVISGKCVLGASTVSSTEERMQSMLFTDPFYTGGIKALVRRASSAEKQEITSVDELNSGDKRVGVVTGSYVDQLVAERLPEAECCYYDSHTDLAMALAGGNIDAFASDEPIMIALTREFGNMKLLDEYLANDEYGVAFPKTEKGRKLCDELSEFLTAKWETGEMEKMYHDWMYSDEDERIPYEFHKPESPKDTIMIGADAENAPMCYVKNAAIVGFMPDFMMMFAEQYGYDVKFTDMRFATLLPALASEQIDCALSTMSITEERKESVYFSTPYYKGGISIAVMKSDSAKRPEDFNGKKLGVLSGSVHDDVAAKYFPDSEVEYYNELSDLAAAVLNGNVSAFTCDKVIGGGILRELSGLKMLDTEIPTNDCGQAFAKNEDGDMLRIQMNEFLAKIRADGTLDEIYDKWLGSDYSGKTVDMTGLPDTGRVIRMGTFDTFPPFAYISNGEFAGYDVEIAVRFCKEYGYGLEITGVTSSSMLMGLSTGQYDIVAGAIAMTDERRESVNFADADYSPIVTLIVKDDAGSETDKSLWASVRDSFEKTFVREQRWKLIVRGIATTVEISVCAAALGTLLGFGICMMRRSRKKLISGFACVYIRILQGTPILVLLMILFYVVFAGSGLTGEMVAIAAFALNFAAYVSEMMRTGIEAVDRGQTEAALALGYTPAQSFIKIVLPQAAMHFIPVYKGELISLVKSTSVVGYIAVQDLTKMSDIIRSRTYDAFFPLIVTAIIYFVISGLLTRLLRLMENSAKPNRTKRGVKGVKIK